ncbi:glycosyltransferase [Campylobacter coli]
MIYFCHDIIPILYPEYTADGKIAFEQHSCMMKLMLWSADLIFTTSQAVKQDVLSYSQEIGVHPPKVVAKEIGAEENFLKIRWSKQDYHKHFIYVGTFEPRKNHILLFLAWKKLYSILQEKTPMLYIIGRKGWLIDWLDRYFEVEPNVSRFVKRLENIQDSQLEKLMLESYATLNPSYTEGWGMPVAESVSMGIPTVCSDIPAYHESSQECAIFLSPLNVDIWVDTILDILNDRVIFPDHVYKIPTWKEYFAEIDEILNKNYFLREKKQYIQYFYDNIQDFRKKENSIKNILKFKFNNFKTRNSK